MTEPLTVEEIREKYSNCWVIIQPTELNIDFSIVKAIVITYYPFNVNYRHLINSLETLSKVYVGLELRCVSFVGGLEKLC